MAVTAHTLNKVGFSPAQAAALLDLGNQTETSLIRDARFTRAQARVLLSGNLTLERLLRVAKFSVKRAQLILATAA